MVPIHMMLLPTDLMVVTSLVGKSLFCVLKQRISSLDIFLLLVSIAYKPSYVATKSQPEDNTSRLYIRLWFSPLFRSTLNLGVAFFLGMVYAKPPPHVAIHTRPCLSTAISRMSFEGRLVCLSLVVYDLPSTYNPFLLIPNHSVPFLSIA